MGTCPIFVRKKKYGEKIQAKKKNNTCETDEALHADGYLFTDSPYNYHGGNATFRIIATGCIAVKGDTGR